MAKHHTTELVQQFKVLVEIQVTIPNNQLEGITLAKPTTTSSRIYFEDVFFLPSLLAYDIP